MSHGPAAATGAALGFALAAGLLLVLTGLPWRRRPTLDQRLAPYLAGVVPAARHPVRAAGAGRRDLFTLLAGPSRDAAVRWLERISGGSVAVQRRLDQLGRTWTVEQFRAQQLAWGLAGAAAGGLIGSGAALLGSGLSAVPLLGSIVIGTLLGVLGRDQALSWQVRRRQERILAEFPAVAELLALSVGAG
jgi:tight adherence protein C